jgi:TetR/AcrR family fatty acid metabolism transcriptional regulator
VTARRDGAADKRRLILDAAIRVFAREGFHRCRVSDIAREANVAYGLVYHYFRSKDEVLDTLFTERWTLLLEAIAAESDRSDCSARDKLHSIAAFIIDSYRNDPHLMKVIIVEVTRAANTFGRAHLTEIRQAYESISAIVATGQEDGTFRSDIAADFATLCFYGAIEQLLTAWIFDQIVMSPDEYDRACQMLVETVCDGLAVRTQTQVPGVTT